MIIKKVDNGGQLSNEYDVVFLAKSKISQLADVKTTCTSNSILLVTESSQSTSKGSVIYFRIVSGKPVIELSEKQASINKLKITSELKKLAKLVD